MFNHALQHDILYDWITHLHKGEDKINVNNCEAIMFVSLIGKIIWMYIGIKGKCMG